ncbi:MAG: tRNA glutamyl-Q(34) synthetase GluQRS, partial [Rhodospirillales bacterium]|nr:tRNA glutamyl-Q(34) synthetase GluQRS [Rhodospirillales bacterium]
MPPTTRFAPSPTGHLHLGHAFAALTAWRRARAAGGRFLLRIEDIDAGRCRPEFTAAILEDLAWLGLDWDGLRVQSAQLEGYRATLDALRGRGLLYPCFCTRADIAAAAAAPHGVGGLYPGTCRALSEPLRAARIARGEPHAWRLDLARAQAMVGELAFEEEGIGRIRCDAAPFGDAVLARKDAPASYHLCATHDDALDGVTLVTRGEDLLAATHLHRLLQALMGWPAPRYAHHPLRTDAAGRRLAKRDGATTLRALRAAGMSPAAVREAAL